MSLSILCHLLLVLLSVSTSVFLCAFLSRAVLLPHASGSYPCVLFPFSQFCSSSLAHSLSLSSSFPPTLPPRRCSSSVSFFSLRALFLSPPRPVARSASIRGIFEPVHDGRLLPGPHFSSTRAPKYLERKDRFRRNRVRVIQTAIQLTYRGNVTTNNVKTLITLWI